MKDHRPLRPETNARIKELESFKNLKYGWDEYSAGPLSEEAEQLGLEALNLLDPHVVVTTIVPGPSDELQLNFRYEGFDVELMVDDIDLRWIVVLNDGIEKYHFSTTKEDTFAEAVQKGLDELKVLTIRKATSFTRAALDQWLAKKSKSGWEGLDADAIINELRS